MSLCPICQALAMAWMSSTKQRCLVCGYVPS